MKPRTHAFLTLFLASLMIGYTVFEISDNRDVDSVRLDNIDLEENQMGLNSECFRLDIGISDSQTSELRAALTGNPSVEYSVLSQILAEKGEVERVEVKEKDNEFRGNIILNDGNKIDLNPSDAVIFASESNSPVYIDRETLYSHGQATCIENAAEF